jgi:hypothetical protein
VMARAFVPACGIVCFDTTEMLKICARVRDGERQKRESWRKARSLSLDDCDALFAPERRSSQHKFTTPPPFAFPSSLGNRLQTTQAPSIYRRNRSHYKSGLKPKRTTRQAQKCLFTEVSVPVIVFFPQRPPRDGPVLVLPPLSLSPSLVHRATTTIGLLGSSFWQ